MLYCRLIYMLSILCVRLTIKVKVGIPESFKVGWYPQKKLGRVTLNKKGICLGFAYQLPNVACPTGKFAWVYFFRPGQSQGFVKPCSTSTMIKSIWEYKIHYLMNSLGCNFLLFLPFPSFPSSICCVKNFNRIINLNYYYIKLYHFPDRRSQLGCVILQS